MNKNSIDRYHVNSDLLKRVIIRIDYQGMTSVEDWITRLKNQVFSNFLRYSRSYMSSSQVKANRLDEVWNKFELPEGAFFSEPLHTFSALQIVGHEDDVRLDVTNYFTILTIDCKKYTYIDDYLEMISNYVELLLAYDKFINIKRIGIRKVSGREFEHTDNIYDVFEKYIIFPNPVDSNVLYEWQSYQDLMYKQEKGVKVNFTRQCREVKVKNMPMVQLIVDIDAYTTTEELQMRQKNLPEDTRDVLKEINDYIFELFKNSVNERYLNGER